MAAPPPLSGTAPQTKVEYVSIAPLLKILSEPPPKPNNVPAKDIALAFSRTFENRLNSSQLAALLTLLHSTGKDKHPDVIAECAAVMREAAVTIDTKRLAQVIGKRKRVEGSYRGGLCDIVGTGGDSHSTFNISTTASILASPLLLMAKHGNRAQTSMSGSADVLNHIQPKPPNISALTADRMPEVYENSKYAFLFAPNFHHGMAYAATVRRELGLRTIFNLMGPLANPVESLIEARVIGVAYQQLGPIFAEALRFNGATKAMVICGAEDLDELSCAGETNCWLLKEVPNPKYKPRQSQSQSQSQFNDTSDSTNNADEDDDDTSDDEPPEQPYISKLETFTLHPRDFGLPTHPLSAVGGGKLPRQNAAVLMSLLRNELGMEHPIVQFVLLNVAALLVVSGVCDADEASDGGEVIKERGPGGGRWKEGVRRAKLAIEKGTALAELEKFIEFTNRLS